MLRARVLVAAGVLAAVATVIVARRELATWVLAFVLARAGLGDVAFSVAEIGPGRLLVNDLRARTPYALEIRSLAAHWSVARLARGRLDELSLEGVRVRADVRTHGEEAGDSLRPRYLTDLLLAWPGALRIEDASADLVTDAGPLRLALEATLEPRAADRLHGEVTLDATGATSHATLALSIEGPRDALQGTLSMQVEVAEPELPVAIAVNGDVSLSWRDGVLELDTPRCLPVRIERLSAAGLRLVGPVAACATRGGQHLLSLSVREDAPLRYRADIALTARAVRLATGSASDSVALSWRAPRILLVVETELERAEPSLSLEATGESLHVSPAEVRAGAWRAVARVRDDVLDLRVDADAVRGSSSPAYVAPLALMARLDGPLEEPLALRFTLASARRHLVLSGEGTVSAATSEARARLRLAPVSFGGPGPRLFDLSPYLGTALGSATGAFEAAGSAHWSASGLRLDIDLTLREASFESRVARFVGVSGRVRLQGPPWESPPDQVVSAALTDVGLPLTDGLLHFRLLRGGALDIESAKWRMLGGVVTTQGPLDFSSDRNQLVLEVRGLDLAEVTQVAQIPGLSGTGALDGVLPLRFSAQELRLDDARLHATEGGLIQYRPPPDASPVERPELALMLRALEDFHYQDLRVTMNGDARDTVQTALHLRGFNPELEDGRIVELNVALAAPLASLLRTNLASDRLPDAVERRFRDFPGAER